MHRVVFWRLAVNNMIDKAKDREERTTDKPIEQTHAGTNAQCKCTATSTCLDCIDF